MKSRFLLSGPGGHCSLWTVSFKVIRLLEILAKQRRKELQAERSRGAENEVQKGRRQNTSEIQDGKKLCQYKLNTRYMLLKVGFKEQRAIARRKGRGEGTEPGECGGNDEGTDLG